MRNPTVNAAITLIGALAAASIALGAAAGDKARAGEYPSETIGRSGRPALPVLITRSAVALRRPDGTLTVPAFHVASGK
jgi:hypothetical protein